MRYLLATLLLPAALHAQEPDRAAFITTLGNDTIGVESLERTPTHVRAAVVLRVPKTTLRVYDITLNGNGVATQVIATSYDPTLGVTSAALSGDTTRVTSELPFIDMVHWPFDLVTQRMTRERRDTATVPFVSGTRTTPFVMRRTGESYSLTHPTRGTMTANVDAQGRMTSLDASQTTRALHVERTDAVDINAIARSFAARDAGGAGIASLSGRATSSFGVNGATVTFDYGTPAVRGRNIFGGLVQFGRVWRTGANEATHMTTDRPLVVGGTTIPAGRYTLFSIPEESQWTLIVSRKTDIAGTAYDQTQDVVRIPMKVRRLGTTVENFTITIDSGELRLQWADTEAYANIDSR
jgi:hypothetical protein